MFFCSARSLFVDVPRSSPPSSPEPEAWVNSTSGDKKAKRPSVEIQKRPSVEEVPRAADKKQPAGSGKAAAATTVAKKVPAAAARKKAGDDVVVDTRVAGKRMFVYVATAVLGGCVEGFIGGLGSLVSPGVLAVLLLTLTDKSQGL
jgi:hypothetical protein